MTEEKRVNSSLLAKSHARLAAAQLLYRIDVTGEKQTPEKLVAEYQAGMGQEKKLHSYSVAADKKLLLSLLTGVREHEEALNSVIDRHLSESWKRERMSPLMLAILRLGAYELDHSRKLATPVIVKEYTQLASRFFNDEETGFVHSILWTIGNFLRGES